MRRMPSGEDQRESRSATPGSRQLPSLHFMGKRSSRSRLNVFTVRARCAVQTMPTAPYPLRRGVMGRCSTPQRAPPLGGRWILPAGVGGNKFFWPSNARWLQKPAATVNGWLATRRSIILEFEAAPPGRPGHGRRGRRSPTRTAARLSSSTAHAGSRCVATPGADEDLRRRRRRRDLTTPARSPSCRATLRCRRECRQAALRISESPRRAD